MLTRDDLKAALADPQIAAFLHVIREGESNQNDDAYTLINGGSHFDSFADHPFAHQSAPPGKAAGAYQFIPHTWDGLVQRYGFTNFSPQCQDEGATALILEHYAQSAIDSGQIAQACQILGKTWVSLPALGTARAERAFVKFGGTLPVLEPGTVTQPTAAPAVPWGTSTMPFLALLPLIAQFIPQIMTLIKPNSVSTAKDAQVAGTILNTVVQAAGIVAPDGTPAPVNATTVAQAADKMAADPALAKSVQTAVVTHPDVLPLLEVGGGVAAAREADLKAQASDKPFWKASPVFWISIIMLPLVYWLVGSLIVGGQKLPDDAPWWVKTMIALFGGEWTGEARSGGFNLVIGLILGGICGVYYGVSVTQQKQQPTAATDTKD